MDSIAAGGETETTTAQRVFWCALEGIVAASLLVAGGLGALQSVTIASALPFSIVILVLVWSLFKGMRADLAQQVAHAGIPNAPTAQPAAGLTWQRRLGLMLHAPSEREVLTFVEGPAMKALSEVASELNNRGRDTVVVSEDNGSIALRSSAEGVRDFIYGIMPASHQIPAFSTMAVGKPEFRFEARTYFSSGGRGYDVMGMTKEQLISDVLVQFERYLALVHTPETQLVHSAPEHSADM